LREEIKRLEGEKGRIKGKVEALIQKLDGFIHEA
jgi:hypothetical protein